MNRVLLTNQRWEKIKPLLPPERGYWGRPSRSHRRILEGILWILRTGAPWRDLPSRYGPWSSCYNRFNRWNAMGVWQNIWEALKDDIDNENHAVDGSIVKAHQDACRVKKKQKRHSGSLEVE
jgi:transposase